MDHRREELTDLYLYELRSVEALSCLTQGLDLEKSFLTSPCLKEYQHFFSISSGKQPLIISFVKAKDTYSFSMGMFTIHSGKGPERVFWPMCLRVIIHIQRHSQKKKQNSKGSNIKASVSSSEDRPAIKSNLLDQHNRASTKTKQYKKLKKYEDIVCSDGSYNSLNVVRAFQESGMYPVKSLLYISLQQGWRYESSDRNCRNKNGIGLKSWHSKHGDVQSIYRESDLHSSYALHIRPRWWKTSPKCASVHVPAIG